MKRIPSDESIERSAGRAAGTVAVLTGVDATEAAIGARVEAAYVATHDTRRTSASPERTYAPHVSAAMRARQFGGARTEAASYPVLVGAPHGTPQSLAGVRADERALRLSQAFEVDQARNRGERTHAQSHTARRLARRMKGE